MVKIYQYIFIVYIMTSYQICSNSNPLSTAHCSTSPHCTVHTATHCWLRNVVTTVRNNWTVTAFPHKYSLLMKSISLITGGKFSKSGDDSIFANGTFHTHSDHAIGSLNVSWIIHRQTTDTPWGWARSWNLGNMFSIIMDNVPVLPLEGGGGD